MQIKTKIIKKMQILKNGQFISLSLLKKTVNINIMSHAGYIIFCLQDTRQEKKPIFIFRCII